MSCSRPYVGNPHLGIQLKETWQQIFARNLEYQNLMLLRQDLSMLGVQKQTIGVAMRRSTLTQRESQVMKLLAEGNAAKQVATVLGVSVKTVEAHKFNLMRKLDVHNKAQLVTVAIQKKILSMPQSM
jgi:DNA-binding NarL/FixJ family response regulator